MDDIYLSDPDTHFVAELIDGYSFRNLVELLRVVSTTCNLHFSKEGIYYEQSDPEQCIIMRWMIHAEELIDYVYESKNPQTIIGININNLRTVAKTVGKKDGLKIYKVKGERPVYIQVMGATERGSERKNVSTILPQAVDQVYYDIPEYTDADKGPNCVVQANIFAKVCANITSVKCKTILVTSNSKGITLSAVMDNGVISRAEALGDGTRSRPMVSNGEVSIQTKYAIVKALSKINNLSSQGMIKFYSQPGNPIKATCKIGSYGSLEIYLILPMEE